MFSNNFLWMNGKENLQTGFVAVGQNSVFDPYNANIITTSPDGITWTTRSVTGSLSEQGTYLTSVAWSSSLGTWVASGTHRPGFPGNYQKMWTSPNGTIWTPRDIPTMAPLPYALSTKSVVWVPELSKFIAGGNLTSSLGYSFLTSTDGITWTPSGGKTEANYDVTAIAYSPTLGKTFGVWSSGNPGEYSSNLSSWLGISGSQNNLYAIIWVSELSRFITVGDGTQAGYSTNGTSFVTATAAENGTWRGLAWSPTLSRAVAVGRTGTKRAMYSSDGATWSNVSVTGASTQAWNAVTWSPELSKFIAVGDGGWTMSSSDGITWTQTPSSISFTLTAVNRGLISA